VASRIKKFATFGEENRSWYILQRISSTFPVVMPVLKRQRDRDRNWAEPCPTMHFLNVRLPSRTESKSFNNSIFLLHPINLICVPKFRHIGYRIWHADRHHCQNPQAYKSEYDSALCKNFGSQYQPGNAKNRNGSDCIDSRGTGSKARRTSWSGQEQTSISESEPQKSAFTAFIQELTEICCYSVAESYNLSRRRAIYPY